MPDFDRIIADLESGQDVDRAVAAAEQLDDAADETWLPRLHQLLAKGGDFFIREAAAVPIARLQGLQALPELLCALARGEEEGHDNDLLGSLISDLVWASPEEAAPLLRGMLSNTDNTRRAHAAWLWGFASAAVEPEPILRLLKDENASVRAAVCGSLATFRGRPAALEGLLTALDDVDGDVRLSAAASLGDFADTSAAPKLREVAAGDPSERVRDFASESLKKLKG